MGAQDVPIPEEKVEFFDENQEAVETVEINEFGVGRVRLKPGTYTALVRDTHTDVEVDHSTQVGVLLQLGADQFNPIVSEIDS